MRPRHPWSFRQNSVTICYRPIPCSSCFRLQIIHQITMGKQLSVPDSIPAGFKELIQDCLHPDHLQRPTFMQVLRRLHSLRPEPSPGTDQSPTHRRK